MKEDVWTTQQVMWLSKDEVLLLDQMIQECDGEGLDSYFPIGLYRQLKDKVRRWVNDRDSKEINRGS